MTDGNRPSRSVRPIVIIGAPRSGTNMLRDAICTHPDAATWPCDEINYIWRHGHRSHPTDEFPITFATPELARFVRRAFNGISRKFDTPNVVEKTCANSLRVAFIHALLPDARFVFIFRDGAAAARSASLRWRARYDFSYLAAKARYVPITDVPYYGARFVRDRIHRLLGHEQRAAYWGPRIAGLESVIASEGLLAGCAAQWSSCVVSSIAALPTIDPTRRIVVRYEDLTRDPEVGLSVVSDFLGLRDVSRHWSRAAESIRTPPDRDALGNLDAVERTRVEAHLAPGRAAIASMFDR